MAPPRWPAAGPSRLRRSTVVTRPWREDSQEARARHLRAARAGSAARGGEARPVEPLGTAEWIVVALVALTLAVTMLPVVRKYLRATVAEVGPLPLRRERDEMRTAA